MDDSVVFVFVCFLPIVLLGGLIALIVWAVRAGKAKELLLRVGELEGRNAQLERRLLQMEGWASEVQHALAEGGAPPAKTSEKTSETDLSHSADDAAEIPPLEQRLVEPKTQPELHGMPARPVAPVGAPAQTSEHVPEHVHPSDEAGDEVGDEAGTTEPVIADTSVIPERSPWMEEAAGLPGSQMPPNPPSPPGSPGSPPGGEPAQPIPQPKKIDWEQWIGVRGAAALGGIALTFAALYFFKYSIESGLIGPAARVVIGMILGVGLIFAAEGPLRQRYRVLGDWLAGAGAAILYLCFWSATALYHLIPTEAGFVGMIVVTAACCVLSVRRKAVSVAILGFLGGFATPALLSTGSDRPIALFGYLTLLNAGLIVVARIRKWSFLPAFALGVTSLYQLFWIMTKMGGERLGLGIGIALIVPLLFIFTARANEDGSQAGGSQAGGKMWGVTRVASVLIPFVYALYFALSSDIGPDLWPVGAMLFALCAGAGWMSERDHMPWIVLSSAAASMAVIAAWTMTQHLTDALAWQLAGVLAAVLLPLHFFAERSAKRRADDGGAPLSNISAAALFAIAAMMLMVPIPGARAISVWPLSAVWILGTLAIARHTKLGVSPWTQLAAAITFAIGLAGVHVRRGLDVGFPSEAFFVGFFLLMGVGLQVLAHRLDGLPNRNAQPNRSVRRRAAYHGAAAFACIALFHFAILPPALPLAPTVGYAAVTLFAVLAMLASVRLDSSSWLGGAMLVTAISCLRFVVDGSPVQNLPVTMIGVLLPLALFSFAPLLLGTRARNNPGSWRVASLAPVVFFPSYLITYQEAFGDSSDGLAALLFGALSLAIATASRRIGPANEGAQRTAFVWPAVAAMGFITAAIPMQLENEWVTIGWAVQAVAVLLLWRRVDHPGLKWVALTLFAAVTVRLVLNPSVLLYHPPSGMPIFNWLAYTYLIPMLAMITGARLLLPLDVPRRRAWESQVFGTKNVIVGALAAIAIFVGFVWINLTIIDAFSSGRSLEIPFDRVPARDLTLSISWAVYGLVLLALGIWRKSRPLRAVGTTLIAVTSLKVFLYDLGNLTDLYRVASLVGLAMSLILVSLIYRKFVFGDTADEPATDKEKA